MHIRVLLTNLMVFLLTASSGGGAQTPAVSASVQIEGRVLTADGSDPLGGALVAATSAGRDPRVAVTDEHGRYKLVGLSQAIYTVRVWKNGYPLLAFGQRSPEDLPKQVDLRVAIAATDIDFLLPKAAVISVRVIDEFGQPTPSATVTAATLRFVDGQRKLALVQAGQFLYPSTTDDRGETRLFGLPAGEYYLTARPIDQGPFGSHNAGAQFFYPGTLSQEQASAVAVGAGDEVFVVIVAGQAKRGTLTATISGQEVLTQVDSQMVLLIPSGNAGVPLKLQTTGGFKAPDIPPGDYVIQVRARSAGGAEEFASVQVTFTGEDTTIPIATSKPGVIVGRFVFDAAISGTIPKPSEIQLSPTFLGMSVAPGKVQIHDDWSFQISSIVGVGFLRVRHVSEAWFLKKVQIGGEDMTDRPLDFQSAFTDRPVEIHVTQMVSTLSGRVQGPAGKPVENYVVVVFSEDPSRWTPRSRYVMTGRPDQSGSFKLSGLPPGPYFVCAVDRLERGREYDLATLQLLGKLAKRIVLAQGEAKTETLTLVSAR